MFISTPVTFGLLATLAVSLGLVAISVWRMLFGTLQVKPWLQKSVGIVATAAACTLAVESIEHYYHLPDYRDWRPWITLLSLGGVLGVSWSFARDVQRLEPARLLVRRPATWQMLLFSIALASWSAYRFHQVHHVDPVVLAGNAIPGSMMEVKSHTAVTDRGRALTLFQLDVSDDLFETYSNGMDVRISSLSAAVIRRESSDARTNCHGWVFTGGRFLLRSYEIDFVLQDNGYQMVEQPHSGDLIIYRNESGEVIHTGLVRGVLDDGTVMVESKWGVDGRFLHRPEDQPYSQNFAFYRTPRPDHLIQIYAIPQPPAAGRLAAVDDPSDASFSPCSTAAD